MEQLSRFIEKIQVGNIHNPHTNRHEVLTEIVTVCPNCGGLRSLRHEGKMVKCLDCLWFTPDIDTTKEVL